ncbi:MAG TPA: hypothetical protein PLF79_13655 [Thauera sp.]|uniref:hypothetical protein n=1 Tax=Thauera sp. TaxID=1905334 RepID=UPI002B5A115E|nr:hypothetical protein [Thauera sp.]HRP26236.1 hypothetical protein [Thauera sp.]HRP67120.1 hypothetical protein [Thauera sp.]
MKRAIITVCCLPVLLAACSGAGIFKEAYSEAEWTFIQPYYYPLAGIGGGAILGKVRIPENRETSIASQTLVQALQDLQLSVVEPTLELDAIIPPRTPWETDIAPIPAELVASYNQSFPNLTLRPAIYGIAYDGEHDTSENIFRYRISARLYSRGALSRWSQVDGDRYSGKFFVDRLVELLQTHMKIVAEAQP